MSDTLTAIRDGIEEIFPEADEMDITPDTLLGDIPEWDSMAAVNLQTFLDDAFHVTISVDLLSEETSIEELISFVEHPDKIPETA